MSGRFYGMESRPLDLSVTQEDVTKMLRSKIVNSKTTAGRGQGDGSLVPLFLQQKETREPYPCPLGHLPEHKYSVWHQKYIDDELSLEEFLEWYRNPAHYRPELPSTNRSHKYE